jgi:hypothetical protein
VHLSIRQLREALIAAKANMSLAARLLGCTRGNVWVRVQRTPELQTLCAEIMESNKDGWEEKLEELGMEKNNVVAVLAKLNAHGRDRGYGRHVTDFNVSGRVEHAHLHLHGDTADRLSRLTDAQLDALIEERRAAASRLPEPQERWHREPPLLEMKADAEPEPES